jgi:acyl CoA:acetate/3-ketoacid CoA transferase alpha subunit/acyl CoA:acetate/3-ketoacid CoA transferase beta subunit
MLDPFQKALDLVDPPPPVEGPDKVMPLPEAIARFVRPGMALHTCSTHNRPGAAYMELVRAFRGKDPGFTFSCIGFVFTGILPVYTGIAKKLIATFCGDTYPTPAPNPVISQAWLEGRIEIENWSILSFPMRLLAGAMGVPYIPTRSLAGSTMAEDNKHAYTEIEDENGESFGLVGALKPDLAFIHAPCADRSGNTILTPPFGEEALGAMASRGGVIVTVEKVVDSDFVRRYSHLCKIPSYLVKAVCEVPFGAHPGGVSSQGLVEFDSYADDYDFIEEIRKASKTKESMDEWIREWVDDCPTWEHYLEKLGKQRIWSLKGKADPDSWKSELLALSAQIPDGPEYSPVEMMVVVAGRILAGRMRERDLLTILAGVGASNLAAWLGHYNLKQEGHDVDLMAELGFYGYAPRPADPFIFNYRNMPTAKMLTGIPSIMGVFMAGSQNRCIGCIGAGQMDKYGNINTTQIPGVGYLTGSGGANDICSAASEVLVTALSGKNRFVDSLPYLTSPGKNVRTVVSDIGVMEKPEGAQELVLTGYFPRPGESEEDIVRHIRGRCGWDLKTADNLDELDVPDQEELKLLRIFDPKRQFLGKR